ncbi:MAG TPA: RIP metalloprotease RseP [Myxococcota bacterium]|nr:RIP metalloprotease RseP [Myxococcota bacterium]
MLYFIIFLGALIFFHELGHFLVARMVGVTVLRFSIGFGPKLLGFTYKGTEYWLSLLPLGGYVKFLGDDPSEELPEDQRKQGFLTTDTWRKVLIVLAGPVFNLILPFLIFFPMFLGHSQLPPSLLGSASVDGAAWEAGIRPGDRVTKINGKTVDYWWEMHGAVASNPGANLEFEVDRDGELMTFNVVPKAVELAGLKEIGMNKTVGRIGVTLDRALPIVLPLPDSPAELAGFGKFDAIVSIDGKNASSFEEVIRAATDAKDRTVKFVVAKTELDVATPGESRELSLGPLGQDVDAGLINGQMVLQWLDPESPAALAGLKEGDQLTALDGTPMSDWGFFVEGLSRDPAAVRRISIIRDGEKQEVELSLANPNWVPGAAVPKYLKFGAKVSRVVVTPDDIPNKSRLRYAAIQTVDETFSIVAKTLASLKALVTGRVSVKEMGGPIMIYDIASNAGSMGWAPFFQALAWLSVSLGILNLLPNPVLDGGHIVVFAIETIMRKPMGLKGRVILQYIGLALLLALMVVVFANDIARKWGSLSQLKPPG